MRLSVEIKDADFAGRTAGVWIELQDLNRFIEQLRECEKNRDGEALLKSSSPEEFELTIRAIDSAGHFSAAYVITQVSYDSAQRLIKREVRGEFELDSEFFSRLVNDFSSLITQNATGRVT
jgi:hypothetical protein